MMKPRCLLFAITLATAGAAAAQTAAPAIGQAGAAGAVDKTSQTEGVRFRDERNDRMTVAVRLSGEGPYRFLVDTGADRTAVSRDIVNRLSLAGGAKATMHSVTGVSEVRTAKLPSIEVTRTPLTATDAAVLESAHMGADGILGVDALRSRRVQFDFGARTMSIVPSRVPDFRDEPGTIVVSVRRKNGRLVVTDAVANGKTITVVLDTGSEVSIGNAALRRQLLGSNLLDASHKVDLQSVTGATIPGDYMFVRKLEMGGITLKNLAIVFADAHTFRQLKLDERPAILLGMNAIRAFRKVSIDFANRKFRVLLPEESSLGTRLAEVRPRG
jgi:predicted aspartyl protease